MKLKLGPYLILYNKYVFLQQLEKLISKRMAEYLQSHHNSAVVELQRRVEELRAGNDAWKAQVKELQSRIVEITHSRGDRRRTSASSTNGNKVR